MRTSSPSGTHPEEVLAQETRAGRYQVAVSVGNSTFFVDEPVELGGLGSGPNPYDLLGAALAACTAMTVRLYAQRKAWPLHHISVRVGHTRATVAARDRFNAELMIEGDLDNDQRAKLLDIANRCPVHSTLERGADVHTALRAPVTDYDVATQHRLHMQHMIQSCTSPPSQRSIGTL